MRFSKTHKILVDFDTWMNVMYIGKTDSGNWIFVNHYQNRVYFRHPERDKIFKCGGIGIRPHGDGQ